MLPHSLTNFEIQKFYQNKSGFNGVYFRDNSPSKIKDGAYVTNRDDYSDTGAHWIAFYALNNNVTYFDSFGVKHISEKIRKIVKTIKTYIFITQAYDSIMCGYFCIEFVDFMLAGKTLNDFTNLFSKNDVKKK